MSKPTNATPKPLSDDPRRTELNHAAWRLRTDTKTLDREGKISKMNAAAMTDGARLLEEQAALKAQPAPVPLAEGGPRPGEVPHFSADGTLRHWCQQGFCPDYSRRQDAEQYTSMRVEIPDFPPLAEDEAAEIERKLREDCIGMEDCKPGNAHKFCYTCQAADTIEALVRENECLRQTLTPKYTCSHCGKEIPADKISTHAVSIFGESVVTFRHSEGDQLQGGSDK